MHTSILVVCTGNVCRSPYAERRLAQELAGTGIVVESAGTAALAGRDMDPLVKELLADAGADFRGFRSRQLTAEMVAGADLVVAAAREHRLAAARLDPAALGRVLTLLDLADLVTGLTVQDVIRDGGEGSWVARVGRAALRRRERVPSRPDPDLEDPFGRPRGVFETMAADVDRAIAPLVDILRQGDQR